MIDDGRYPINVADPKVFIGLLIGGSIAFIFSSLAIRAVSRTAGVVVQEVRRQFADGKIMAGTKKPDYGPAIDICTTASLRELATPALLAVLAPVIIGFGLGPISLGAFLACGHRRRPAHGQLPAATPAAPGTTPRSTSRTAPRAARAPRATRPPSSATPSATRSRTPPARPSTR